ncbi:hypothetical protein [Streptomyces sp. NPDC052496]|uniref:hypothetical protein n=1 Tax=Streptomyces sp. NPDC052496 TaxID=3154951 RepID=UPI00343F23DC
MTDNKTSDELADVAVEAMRVINELTRSRSREWKYPGDVYSLIGGLSTMAMMLPQALDQAARLIAGLNEGGHLRSDKDHQLEDDLGEIFHDLDAARTAAEKLYVSLTRAHSGLGSLTYKD